MVPRLALVQEQGRLLPGDARGQVVGVEIEGARPRAIGRARVVGAAGLELLAEGGIGPDHQRRLGHQREILRDLGVDRFLDPVIIAASATPGSSAGTWGWSACSRRIAAGRP